jgi:hypothetical protein
MLKVFPLRGTGKSQVVPNFIVERFFLFAHKVVPGSSGHYRYTDYLLHLLCSILFKKLS